MKHLPTSSKVSLQSGLVKPDFRVLFSNPFEAPDEKVDNVGFKFHLKTNNSLACS